MKHLEDIGEELFDFSNFSCEFTGLPMIIWIRSAWDSPVVPIIYVSIKYGDKILGIEHTFAMSIDDKPIITSGDTGEIRENDIEKVKKWITLNKKALMRHWKAKTTTDQFMDESSKVDGIPGTRFSDALKKKISLLLEEKDDDLDKYFTLYERTLERNLIGILNQVNIQASVKSEPYSLPFYKEILIPVSFIGFKKLNQAELYRSILKQLLNENVKKMRFYFYIGSSGSLASKPEDQKNDLNKREIPNTLTLELPHLLFCFRYRVDKY